jgi:hypothetical protein
MRREVVEADVGLRLTTLLQIIHPARRFHSIISQVVCMLDQFVLELSQTQALQLRDVDSITLLAVF